MRWKRSGSHAIFGIQIGVSKLPFFRVLAHSWFSFSLFSSLALMSTSRIAAIFLVCIAMTFMPVSAQHDHGHASYVSTCTIYSNSFCNVTAIGDSNTALVLGDETCSRSTPRLTAYLAMCAEGELRVYNTSACNTAYMYKSYDITSPHLNHCMAIQERTVVNNTWNGAPWTKYYAKCTCVKSSASSTMVSAVMSIALVAVGIMMSSLF